MENKQSNSFHRLIVTTVAGVVIGSTCLFVNFLWWQGFSVNKVLFYTAVGFLWGTFVSFIFETKSSFPKFFEEKIKEEGRRLRDQYLIDLKRNLKDLALFIVSRENEEVNMFLKGLFDKETYSFHDSFVVMMEDLKIDISNINRLRKLLSVEEKTKEADRLQHFLDDSFSGLEDDPTDIISLSVFSEIISERKARWRDLFKSIKGESSVIEAGEG